MLDASDDGAPVPPLKRARVQPEARRALSCSECKRRKTKCSALGKTPCDACVKRGRPADCVWEGYDGPVSLPVAGNEAQFALAADVDALRLELEQLRQQVAIIAAAPAPGMHLDTSPQIAITMSTQAESTPIQWDRAAGTVGQDDATQAVTSLEDEVAGPLPGSRGMRSGPQLSAEADADLARLLALLPHPNVGSVLVGEYLDGPSHKGWHVIEQISFRAQLRDFTAAPGSVDPAWLGLYFMVLALAAKLSTNLPSLFPAHALDYLSCLPQIYQQASVKALELADYLAVPQIRHIQVALLSIQYFFHFGDSGAQANLALRHLDAAISTAQWLELDLIAGGAGGDAGAGGVARVPFDDPALAQMDGGAAVELCKRLVHTLSFLDGTIQKRTTLWRLAHVATPLPENYASLADMALGIRPPHELTEASLSRIGSVFASAIRGIPMATDMSIEQVAELDRKLREPLDLIPIGHGTLDDMWMILMVFCSIHNRLVRAHRLHAMKDQAIAAHRQARQACVESALRLISTLLLFNVGPRLRPHFTKRWIIGAALVLVVDHVLGGPASRAGLVEAHAIFVAINPYDTRAQTTAECARLVEVLIAVGDERLASGRVEHIEGIFGEVRMRFRAIPSSDVEVDFDAIFRDFPLLELNLMGFSQGI
ncbi:hypothetical protein Q5752_001586 [Cryptotrichosporon argae]